MALGEQGRDDGTDIARETGPSESGLGSDEFVDLRNVSQGTAAKVRLEPTGRNGVGGDPPRSEFLGQVASEHLDGALDAAVHGVAWQGHSCQTAGDVHVPSSILDQ